MCKYVHLPVEDLLVQWLWQASRTTYVIDVVALLNLALYIATFSSCSGPLINSMTEMQKK